MAKLFATRLVGLRAIIHGLPCTFPSLEKMPQELPRLLTSLSAGFVQLARSEAQAEYLDGEARALLAQAQEVQQTGLTTADGDALKRCRGRETG